MKKSTNNYTFMFFPEGRGFPFTLSVHRYTLYLTVVSVALIIIGLFVLLAYTGGIAVKLQLVSSLRAENARLQERNRDLEISSQRMANIDSLTAYLHRLASVADIGGRAEGAGAPKAAVDKGKPGLADTARGDARGPRKGAPGSGDEFASSMPNIMPVDGWITKHFSSDPAVSHYGMDVAAASGTPIRATAMGVVEDVRNDKYYGLVVEVRHENGFLTRYGHCSQALVSLSDRVQRGQTIALVGNTGRSTAPHLHYEVMKNGKYADPMNFIGAHKE